MILQKSEWEKTFAKAVYALRVCVYVLMLNRMGFGFGDFLLPLTLCIKFMRYVCISPGRAWGR